MRNRSSSITRLARKYKYPADTLSLLSKYYSLASLEKILSSLREPGPRYYVRVNTLRASPRDVMRILESEGIEAERHDLIEEAIHLPVDGRYEVFEVGKRLVIDKHAAESVYMGAHLYAPGIPKPVRMDTGDLVTLYSPGGDAVANGIAVMSHSQILEEWRGLAVWNIRSPFKAVSLREHRLFKEGIIYNQSLPSMVALHALNPQPGEKILDMCAAPGGKATHAAELMHDEGLVVAVDRSEKKVSRIREHAARLGLKSIKGLVHDSRYITEILGEERFDKVILDPPCSALGVRPKLVYNRSLRDILSLVKYQRQFLKEASRALKKGGLLLYTTCTLTLEENEYNVIYAEEELGLEPVDVPVDIGSRPFLGVPGIRFEPDIHSTPGFFISLLRKRS